MSHKEEADNVDIETRLGLLEPSGAGTSRDRLIFAMGEAWGRRSAERSVVGRWGWPSAAVAMTVIAASLLGVLLTRPSQMYQVPAGIDLADGRSDTPSVDVPPVEPAPLPVQADMPPVWPSFVGQWLASRSLASPADDRRPVSYEGLKTLLLQGGPDAFPRELPGSDPAATPTAPVLYRQLRDDLLEQSPGHFTTTRPSALGADS
jgi:hypothetical protein